MTSEQSTIQEIISSLESNNPEEREAAANQLREKGKQGLNVEEGMIALSAAAKEYPPRKYDFQDTSADLIRAVTPKAEYISVITDLYPRYNDKGKEEALRLLASIENREAAMAYMKILRIYARTGDVPTLPTQPLQDRPRYADIFFPDILDYADIQVFEWDIYLLLLSYFRANLLSSHDLIPYSNRILDGYYKYKDNLVPSQQNNGIAWMWENEYQGWRNITSLILDVLGYFPTTKVEKDLQEALTYKDPRLKYFAITSLLRQGKEVDSPIIREVASSAEMRNLLYDWLVESNRASLFPEEFRTQEAFAESDMVNWLIYPTELGREPDEIELMKVVSIDTGTEDGIIDYYVFRFRTHPPHWAAKDNWMAGVSGPFLRKDAPSTRSYGETFSSFESWDSKTPEEHVGNVQEILRSWQEYHNANQKAP